MSITKLAIRFAAPRPKIESYRRYLFVGPHPDDIEIGCGQTVAKLTAAGKEVSFLICIDGREGDAFSGGIKGDALAALRMEEARASAAHLGVRDVHFLSLRDGAGYSIGELERGIARVLCKLKPEIVFAPDPQSGSECHADHLNVGNAVKKVGYFAPYAGIMRRLAGEPLPEDDVAERVPAAENITAAERSLSAEGGDDFSAPVDALAFYMTAKPNRYVRTPGLLQKQYDAIFRFHTSQYPEGSSEIDTLKLYLKLRSVEFGLRNFSSAAEGFRVLGRIHMHCLPEA